MTMAVGDKRSSIEARDYHPAWWYGGMEDSLVGADNLGCDVEDVEGIPYFYPYT